MRRALGELSAGERIVLVAGLLLIADLLFVPWHSVDVGDLDIVFDGTRTGVEDPNGAYGVVAAVLAAIMVVQIVIARLTPIRLPDPPFLPWPHVHLIAGIFVFVVLAIKLARETELLGFGSYSGVLAGLLVANGGYRIAQQPLADEAIEPGDEPDPE